MTKFFEQLTSTDKEKYLKDIKRDINLETYPKVKDFLIDNNLYVTNVKTNPIKVKEKNATVILDNSDNKWFILCVDGKIQLLSKKNVIIHTDIFNYDKRDANFTKKYKMQKLDYLVEYVENVGANLSLSIKNYNDKIGKARWQDETSIISSMTIHNMNDNNLNGYTYNGDDFSLCIIGKNFNKERDILN